MSKQRLNLSIEESIKRRAKRIAKQRGISVSRFFEEMVTTQDDPEEWKPEKGSAVERLMNLIPESKKMNDPDYDKMRYNLKVPFRKNKIRKGAPNCLYFSKLKEY